METARHKGVNRPAAARPVPAAAPPRPVPTGGLPYQGSKGVSSPHDPAEREAVATARKVLRMPAPQVRVASGGTRGGPGDVPPERGMESPYTTRFADAMRLMRQHAVGASPAPDLARGQGGGAPLPDGVRGFMEPRFGANFSNVRIHAGENAARLSRQVSAQAFTVGNQIFFGRARFQPETPEGRELIAHELTHTLQQGATVQDGLRIQRREDVTVTQQASPHVQRLGVSDALGYFADAADALPGFRMFTLVLGVNPINMRRTDRSPANLLRATVEFLPGGALLARALDTHGVFDRVAGWVERQLGTLGLSGSTFREAIHRFVASLGWSDLLHLGGVWARARNLFTEPIDRLIRHARSLSGAIVRFLQDATLRPLAELASRTRGWDLLCGVLGMNPITGEAVPRTAEGLMGGFMRLIGQEELWENLKRGNAVSRAWSWFQGALGGLRSFVRQLPQRFAQAVLSLGIEDLVQLPRAYARVAGVFGDFLGHFLSWAGNTAWDLLDILFSVVAPEVMVHLRRAASAFRTILRDPVAFVGHLVRAATLGFRQFAARSVTHLRGSLIGWLTGALAGVDLYLPKGLDPRELIPFALSALRLTWQDLRQKLVRILGEPALHALETGFEFLTPLITRGPAAAWEKLQEGLPDLGERVMGQIMTFVQDRVVTAAVTRLLSLLTPAGAFIQAIIATSNTVMFFVERLRQISQVGTAFLDSLAAIAAGSIASAANRVEQTMAGMLTLVISFLARIAGLGKMSDAVMSVVNRVREPMGQALDRVADWVVAQAKRLGRLGAGALGLLPEKRFEAGGEQHRIWVRTAGTRTELVISSLTQLLQDFFTAARANPSIPESRKERIGLALTLTLEMGVIMHDVGGGKLPQAQAEAMRQQFEKHETLLAEIIRTMVAGIDVSRFDERYRLEGMVTTYANMPKQTRDYMTPDHQPQAELLWRVSKLPAFAKTRLRAIAGSNRTDHAPGGMCINLGERRHSLTRTFKALGRTTADIAWARIQSRIAAAGLNEADQRTAAVSVLTNEASSDAEHVLNVILPKPETDPAWTDIRDLGLGAAHQTALIDRIRGQIRAGIERLRAQDFDRFKHPD